jgi:hypothetical protein
MRSPRKRRNRLFIKPALESGKNLTAGKTARLKKPEGVLMKTMGKTKKGLFVMGLVCLSVMAMVWAGCASAPPTAFETAESLEGTAWMQGMQYSILVMNDETSGVFTDRDDKETAFTYTAAYDPQKRTFAGTITLEDGRVAEFSAKKAGISSWAITAKELEEGSFQYKTPEQLEQIYQQKRVKAEIVEKYGSEYLVLNDLTGWSNVLKREGAEFYIKYSTYDYGLHQTNPNAAVQVVRTGYRLHSTDGVTMTLLSVNTTTQQYAGVEGVGTFNIHVSGNTVTISDGTGEGTQFNGTYKVQ